MDGRIRSALGQLIHKSGEAHQPTIVIPDGTQAMRLLVIDGHLGGIDCGGELCARGLAHDLQALLVAAASTKDPAPIPATPEQVERFCGRMRSPVTEAVAVCEAAVSRDVAVPQAWIDRHAQLVLGPGPDPGERTVFGHHEWRAVRLMLLGGLPAVAAGNAWHVAAQVLRSRSVLVAGTEPCPSLTRRPAAVAGPTPEARLWPVRIPGAALAGFDEAQSEPVISAVDGSLGRELAELRSKAAAAAVVAPVPGRPAIGGDVLQRIIDRLKEM